MTDIRQNLQREINEELHYIAARLEQRVEKYVIQGPRQYDEVKARLDDLKQRVDDRMKEVESAMDEIDQSLQSFKENSALNNSQVVSDFKFVLDSFSEIENYLLVINLNSPAPVEEATFITKATEHLNDIFQEGQRVPIVERVRYLLHQDLSFANSCLLTRLNQESKELISFPSGGIKGYNLMITRVKSISSASETLTALDILKEFRPKVTKWTDKIFADFCSVIINSRTGVGCFEHKCPKNDEHLFTVNHKSSTDPVDYGGIFKALSEFFEYLYQAIGHIEIGADSRPLTLYIGGGLKDSLMSLLLKNCISLAAPTADKNDPTFVNVMNEAEKFRNLMIKLHFWNESVPKFLAYAEANDAVFINRRCFDILTEAKKLILEPFIELAIVGTGEEITEEVITHYSEVFGNISDISDLSREDESYPKFLQLQRCKVSNNAVKIVELIEKTVKDAISADNDLLKARLLTTAQNILRLYHCMSSKHHGAAITSVPQAAAVYYNNCYYICHRLILLPFLVISKFPEAVQDLQNDVYAILADNLFLLRESATQCLESMLSNSKRQISTLLSEKQIFVGLYHTKNLNGCKKTIKACIQMMESIRDNWTEIMAEAVYCKSLGNIVDYFLSDLASMFLNVEDIRSSDSDASAIILTDTLTQLEQLFVIRGKTTIHTFCDKSYYRMKEIIFCLNGSLQGISDRWCDGKGPLATWLAASQVRGLVKALFQNTEQRKELLESLC